MQECRGLHKSLTYSNQVEALKAYCATHSITVDGWLQDVESDLNYKRKQFNRLMEMVELGQVRRLVIAHRDRLIRFGYSYFEAFCERHNCEIVVIMAIHFHLNRKWFRT